MKIGILGSGVVGQNLGTGFIRLGHTVMLGTRDEKKLTEWKSNNGGLASVGSFADTAAFGEVIVIATSWSGTFEAITSAGIESFENKIVIDVTNPLDFSNGVPPALDSKPGNSGAEKIQTLLPKSKIVKAFNTIAASIMIAPQREDGDPDFILAGDEEAKQLTAKIASDLGWKGIIDIGDLSQSYLLEAFAMLWITYGFRNNHWTHAFKLLKK